MCWFEQDSHTGDAVLIAPISSQIPCKQGIFQEISPFQLPSSKNRRKTATNQAPSEAFGDHLAKRAQRTGDDIDFTLHGGLRANENESRPQPYG
jgi:hypothetical protein